MFLPEDTTLCFPVGLTYMDGLYPNRILLTYGNMDSHCEAMAFECKYIDDSMLRHHTDNAGSSIEDIGFTWMDADFLWSKTFPDASPRTPGTPDR